MAQAGDTHAPLRIEPGWPITDGCRPVFVIDASSALEERLLRAWIERRRPPAVGPRDYDVVRLPPSRRRRKRRSLRALEACLASCGEALLAPLRVAWLPKKRDGVRSVLPRDLILLRDPRDPGALRQSLILKREPDRCRIVVGEPATVSELRERWHRAGGTDLSQTTGLAEFIARRAVLALERAERMLRGARYKVPRLVHEDILGRPSFRGGIHRLAGALGRTPASVTREASRDLREIAATHSPLVIDLVAWLIRLLYTQGYGRQLYYDRDQLKDVKALAQQNPVVFLPSHKSNLDHLVLQYALHENGHAPNHTAGGINMNFFPVGPLVRRSGTFFIRRSFRDDEIYKFVLHHYIDFLIEKRFSLEWYIEGGRSRAGKLLPPRFGLLAYVVDAYRRAKSEDVFLIPVSIAYDQISDVGDYAAEQRGGAKPRESFGWFLGVVRRLRRRYGNIHIRFGEPLSLAKSLGRPDPRAAPSDDEQNLGLQKLAFEVAVRINRVTPITSISLVTLALLGTGDRALTAAQVRIALDQCARTSRASAACRRSESSISTTTTACAARWRRSSETASCRASRAAPSPSTRSVPSSSSGRLLPQHRDPLLRESGDRGAGAAAGGGARCRRSHRRVLGRGACACATCSSSSSSSRRRRSSGARCSARWRSTTSIGSASSERGARRSVSCCADSGLSARIAFCAPSPTPTRSWETTSSAAIPRPCSTKRASRPSAWGSAASTICSGA